MSPAPGGPWPTSTRVRRLGPWLRPILGVVTAAALCGCAGTRVAVDELVRRGRLSEACRRVRLEEESPQGRRAADLLRRRSGVALQIRALSQREFADFLGLEAPSGYGSLAVALELQLTAAGPADVTVDAVTLGEYQDPRERSAWEWRHDAKDAYALVYPMPEAPVGSSGGSGSSGVGLLGLLGVLSGVLPMASVATGRDLVTPTLLPPRSSGTSSPPSAEALARYERDPQVQLSREARLRLSGMTDLEAQQRESPCRLGPGRSCRLFAFPHLLGEGARPAHPPRPRWLSVRLSQALPPQPGDGARRPGERCTLDLSSDVLLLGDGSALERLQRSVTDRSFPIADLPRRGALEARAQAGERPLRE